MSSNQKFTRVLICYVGADPTVSSSHGSIEQLATDATILELLSSSRDKKTRPDTETTGGPAAPGSAPEQTFAQPAPEGFQQNYTAYGQVPPPPGPYMYYPAPYPGAMLPDGSPAPYYPPPPPPNPVNGTSQPSEAMGNGSLPPPEIARLIPCRYVSNFSHFQVILRSMSDDERVLHVIVISPHAATDRHAYLPIHKVPISKVHYRLQRNIPLIMTQWLTRLTPDTTVYHLNLRILSLPHPLIRSLHLKIHRIRLYPSRSICAQARKSRHRCKPHITRVRPRQCRTSFQFQVDILVQARCPFRQCIWAWLLPNNRFPNPTGICIPPRRLWYNPQRIGMI